MSASDGDYTMSVSSGVTNFSEWVNNENQLYVINSPCKGYEKCDEINGIQILTMESVGRRNFIYVGTYMHFFFQVL